MAETSPETDRYGAAVDEIYAAIEAPARWRDALSAVAACSEDVGAIFIFPREDGSMGTIVTPGLEAVQARFEGGWAAKDLRFERALERGYVASGECVTDRHLASDEEIETHPYYVDLLRPHGLKYFAGLNISPAPQVAAALSVQRSPDKPAFSDAELVVVARLGRHVGRAMAISVKLIGAEAHELAKAGSSMLSEFAEVPAGRRVGVARAIEKLGVAGDGDLSALLTRLATA